MTRVMGQFRFLALISTLFSIAHFWDVHSAQGSESPPAGDFWQRRADGVAPRIADARVFTGDEVIVWGGGRQSTWLNDGARYHLQSDTWRRVSEVNAPSGRWAHAAVWTGREMLVWGGRANFFSFDHQLGGGRYNPQTDSWRPISTAGAPAPRSQLCAVWTAREMIVWGGQGDNATEFSDGARYDPDTDTWTPMSLSPLEPRFDATAIWTGTEMIVFGGLKVDNYLTGSEVWTSFADGARYTPANNTWRLLNPNGGPGSRTSHSAVWTGTEMLIWGGRSLPDHSFLNSGASYNPAMDLWIPIASQNAPQGRAAHAAVWSGTEMIIWAGYVDPSPFEVNTGARYNPFSRRWTSTIQVDTPQKRYFVGPSGGLWTGQAMFIYGGWDYPQELNSTYLYYPESASSAVAEIIRILEDADLPRNVLRPLQEVLENTVQSIEQGNTAAAINQLQAFQNKVAARLTRTRSHLINT